jgi:hypothetical protein
MVCLVQTMHLSGIKISTISKWTKMSFRLCHITSEYHQVHLKWLLSLWYVQRKPCTYLASRLALSPNGPKRASTWASSSSNSIGCIPNNFLSLWYIRQTGAPALHLCYYRLQMDQNEIRVPSGASKIISEPMVCSAQTVHLSFVKIKTVSKQTEMRFNMTHVT